MAQNLQNTVEAPGRGGLFFHDGRQHVNANRNPNLPPHGVVARTVKMFDALALLDPSGKQFHFPTALVEPRDRQGRQLEVISQKGQTLPGFRIDIVNAPQIVRIVFDAGGIARIFAD